MKKALCLIFAMALTIAITVPAAFSAETPEFKMRAWYMLQGVLADNIGDFSDDYSSDCHGFAYSRFRWWLDASFDKKYGGTVGFEGDWWWAKKTTPGPDVTWGGQGQDQLNVEWKNAYVWFLVPGTNIKMTGGLQTWIIDPDTIMFGANADWWSWRADIPIGKSASLTLGWLKQEEGGIVDNSDESEYYLLKLSGAFGKMLSGGFYSLYLNVRDDAAGVYLDGYPYTSYTGYLAGLTGGRSQFLAKAGYAWWNGLHLALNFDPIYVKLHGNYLFGSFDKAKYGYREDPEISAWAALGEVGIKTKKGIRVGLKGWYFTGNDEDWSPTSGNYKAKWHRWSTPDAFFCPTEIFYMGARFWPAYALITHVGAPGGTWAYGLDGTIPFTKNIRLDFTLVDIRWTDGEYDKPSAFLGSAPYKNTDEHAGYELNLLLTYKPYANLEMNFLFAYFFAQDGLDRNPGSPTNEMDASNAIKAGYRVLFTF